ncbi:MAG: hypothetical protein K5756_02740 [Clostridiales bacterium]|nr:hypothetical protein [Clostridiales bacterium]
MDDFNDIDLREWQKFADSGRLEDYLLYRKYARLREERLHAHEHGRTDNKGEQHGGK